LESEFNIEAVETQKCLDSIDYLLRYKGSGAAERLVQSLQNHVGLKGSPVAMMPTTPYINTISVDEQPEYPGDFELEKKIRSAVRWNAMAMVVSANREHEGLGGHISTYASLATLYEIGFTHFFRGPEAESGMDHIYFQGHASPGNYARAFLEGRLNEQHLRNFRQELAEGGGLSSYPHPYLMPDFWQFPTVSMGLGPINAIYHARFMRYLVARGLKPKAESEARVWCFVGDGETGEPETLGQLNIASREKLDNLIFVVNCNLQRLDGPVNGNGKIIQELEGVFRGAGWNVIKVIWGSDWDELLKGPHAALLIKRLGEVVDGQFQKYCVSPGSYIRRDFFGKYPELLEAVSHLTDVQLQKMTRGGHDSRKVYAAYKRAMEMNGKPTVILAQTVKGYGLGEAGEGKNISHQQKKMNERELREFRARFEIPISDEDVVDAPFYKPKASSPEMKYYLEQRKQLGGYVPSRLKEPKAPKFPGTEFYQDFYGNTGDRPISTTMAFVRVLTKLLRDKDLGPYVVPIIPDEARTFGMEALFRQVGIYAHSGQLYEPMDKDTLLYYREEKDGQILEEGINEAGSMASFIAAGTAYSNHGIPTIPFYIYYSMFGFQRVGDSIWAAADSRVRGFLLGGTAGRTTLNGEGLQHQDGHSHLIASTVPNLYAYDPAYIFEIAVIIQDGLKRMYQDHEDVVYYLTLGNENYDMPDKPEGSEVGIVEGMYKLVKSSKKSKLKVQLLGSGSILKEVLRAKDILENQFDIAADVWSVTSYKRLRTEALAAKRWNMFHPTEKAKQSYLEKIVENETDVFIAASDNMKIVADQIAPWIPGGLFTLGTDGFGRSETRENLRRFFEVDGECVAIGALYALSEKGLVKKEEVKKAITKLGVSPEKVYPYCV